MEGKLPRSERTRRSILHAAAELFDTHGIRKVSINDIARKSQISQVTVYNYFASREELLKATAEMVVRSLGDGFQKLVRQKAPFEDKLRYFILQQTPGEERQKSLVYQRFLQEFMLDYAETWQTIRTGDTAKDLFKLLSEDLYKEGREAGYIDPEISRVTFALIIIVIRRGLFYQSEVMPEVNLVPGFDEKLVSFIISGFKGKER